ncbi:MAG: hypothetical protein QM621_11785 [Aeromicrobium sp.]|uniref:hypothetical protein n=1 Tax=Aeromicrobium sp. TaxID=1871063 RepID=UPI0039E46932
MTSRRTFVIGGVAAVALASFGGVAAAGKLDDLARGVGLDPVPQPQASDTALLRAATDDQARLVALATGVSATMAALLAEQWEALGGTTPSTEPPAASPMILRAELASAATTRSEQAVEALSPDLARTLGSMAASLRLLASGAVA